MTIGIHASQLTPVEWPADGQPHGCPVCEEPTQHIDRYPDQLHWCTSCDMIFLAREVVS